MSSQLWRALASGIGVFAWGCEAVDRLKEKA
jgi:hypothetical protein